PPPPPPPPQPRQSGRKSGFEMVPVPGGSLNIDKSDCEGKTSVKLEPFKIGKYEITQADWWNVMGRDPSFHSKCPDCPVERVSWNDVQLFIQKASQKYNKRYRLPYEAEWEWAARGAGASKMTKYAGGNDPNGVAWFNIIQEKTREVGTKRANELGIYDFSGNVWEWCMAPFPPYLKCPPPKSDKKVLRGGSWADNRGDIKIKSRRRENPNNTDRRSGLRLVEE
ncbi:MAG: formylglycine-generating enzyme family protein, partial [Saprospiraceae bacterium]